MYCTHCGNEANGESERCPKCQRVLLNGHKFCNHCGVRLHRQLAKKCPHCGQEVGKDKAREKSEPKSRTIAALLSFFGAWFGAGRFYLGYVGLGLLQLLVSFVTLGLGGIWGLVESFMILKHKINKDYYGNELKD